MNPEGRGSSSLDHTEPTSTQFCILGCWVQLGEIQSGLKHLTQSGASFTACLAKQSNCSHSHHIPIDKITHCFSSLELSAPRSCDLSHCGLRLNSACYSVQQGNTKVVVRVSQLFPAIAEAVSQLECDAIGRFSICSAWSVRRRFCTWIRVMGPSLSCRLPRPILLGVFILVTRSYLSDVSIKI